MTVDGPICLAILVQDTQNFGGNELGAFGALQSHERFKVLILFAKFAREA